MADELDLSGEIAEAIDGAALRGKTAVLGCTTGAPTVPGHSSSPSTASPTSTPPPTMPSTRR